MDKNKIVWTSLRGALGLIFLWAFVDKVFGLGFATKSADAWINGGSPTTGFLKFGAKGPFVEIFNSLAGLAWVDWMFMLGLLFIGTTLLINRYVFWGSIAGIALLMLMWLAVLPPEHHPFIDDHVIYSLVLGVFALKSRGSSGLHI